MRALVTTKPEDGAVWVMTGTGVVKVGTGTDGDDGEYGPLFIILVPDGGGEAECGAGVNAGNGSGVADMKSRYSWRRRRRRRIRHNARIASTRTMMAAPMPPPIIAPVLLEEL